MKKVLQYINVTCITLPLTAAACLFFLLPDEIPAHLTDGVIDRYGSRAEVFIVPAVNAAALLLFHGFFHLLGKQNSSVHGGKIISIARTSVNIVFLCLCMWYFIWLAGLTF